MTNFDVLMDSGKILSGERICELINFIINKFADEGFSRDEALEVLERTKDMLGEVSIVQKIAPVQQETLTSGNE